MQAHRLLGAGVCAAFIRRRGNHRSQPMSVLRSPQGYVARTSTDSGHLSQTKTPGANRECGA